MIRLDFFCHLAPGRQDLGRPSTGAMGYWHKKRVRKVPSVPDELKQQTFRPLKQVPIFFFIAGRRSSTLSSAQRRIIKIKAAAGHHPRMKRLKRTNLGIVRHPGFSTTTNTWTPSPTTYAESMV